MNVGDVEMIHQHKLTEARRRGDLKKLVTVLKVVV